MTQSVEVAALSTVAEVANDGTGAIAALSVVPGSCTQALVWPRSVQSSRSSNPTVMMMNHNNDCQA